MTGDMKEHCIHEAMAIRDALELIDGSGRGVAFVTDASGRFKRTVTDGDVRRLILEGMELQSSLTALPDQKPVVGSMGMARADALEIMDHHG
ncbi:MAG: hypothetical protein AAF412_03240, partial [Pseudomonadota bacterium]